MTSSSSSGETSSEEWRKRPAVQLVATSCQSLPLSSRVLSLSVSLLLFLQRHQLYQISVCMLSCFSHVQLFVTLWTVAHQAPLSIVFSRQEYWSELPFPSPESKLGLLHGRQIPYHLNHQGSPTSYSKSDLIVMFLWSST